MATKKVTATLPEAIFAEACLLARDVGLPLSTWLARTIAHEVRVRRGLEGVREWDEEVGPPSIEAEEWVDEQFAEPAGARVGVGLAELRVLREGLDAVREWEDEHGTLTEAEVAAADARLGAAAVPPRPGSSSGAAHMP